MNKTFIHLFLSLLVLPLLLPAQSPKSTYAPQKISKSILQIAKDMAKENEVHNAAISVAGEKTLQYRRFEGLVKKATFNELLELVEHPNSAVRVYAFWAMAKRKFEKLEAVLMAHAADEQLVYYIEGCLGGDLKVIDFMIRVVTPEMIDWECKKLDTAALDRLQERQRLLKKSRE